MKRFLLSILLMLICTLSYAQVTSADTAKGTMKKGLSVGPLLMYFKLDRGQSETQKLFFVNNKDKAYRFTFSMDDFFVDSLGNYILLDSAQSHFSLSKWISLDKNFLEVGPGERASVEVTVRVPDNEEAVKYMKWAKIMATNEPEYAGVAKQAENVVKIDKSLTVSTQLFLTPPNLTKDVKMLDFRQVNDSTCLIKCENTGEALLACNFSIEFTGGELVSKKKVVKNDISMLPGQRLMVGMSIPTELKKGKYTAIALIDAGEDVPLEAAQISIDVK